MLVATCLVPLKARSDIFGGDVAVLMQILEQNIRHYYQLQQMIQQGRSADSYLRWINAGLNNSIGLLNALPIRDEHVLAELREFRSALRKVQSVYGQIPRSSENALHTLHDETVAESLKMINGFKEYSTTAERNSVLIASEAREASPKGAARMQVETSAEILKSLSQLIRLNTQMLKLQSEQLAFANKQSKEGVTTFQKVNRDLGSGFSNFNPDMKLVKF